MTENSPKVLDLMLVHHGLLEVLFKSLSDNVSQNTNTELIRKMLSEFQWELEKHFFVEEKVLFKLSSKDQPQTYSIIVELLEEHDRMLKMLDEAKELLENKKTVDLAKFGSILMEHRAIEEHKLYPQLEKKLSEEEKQMISKRINQLPLVKTF